MITIDPTLLDHGKVVVSVRDLRDSLADGVTPERSLEAKNNLIENYVNWLEEHAKI